MIALIDYGIGNLKSVTNAIDLIGSKAVLVKDADELKNYSKAILPGVGAFGDAMDSLKKTGMNEAILEFTKNGKMFFGICLGMQLLFEKSHEFGEHAGLGLFSGEVIPFDKNRFEKPLKIPHVGWNLLHARKDSKLLSGIKNDIYLYFVHSFHVDANKKDIVGTTKYGYEFASMVERENIFGFQPHPEKSHVNGLKILKNFMEL